jgi:PIN domain nuclease of toxin-antitoxin system
MIKTECLEKSPNVAYKKHVSFLQKISALTTYDIKILNKRDKVQKESAIQALVDKQIYKNQFNINKKPLKHSE